MPGESLIRPCKPVHQISVEAPIQLLGGEYFLPGIIQACERPYGSGLCAERLQREVLKDIEMGTMGIFQRDVEGLPTPVTQAVEQTD